MIPPTLRRSTPATSLTVIVLSVMTVTICAWRGGHLQFIDLWLYDWSLQHQPSAGSNASPVVLIGITEEDIRAHDYPMSDHQLAHVIDLVAAGEPSVVGVDIYRDLPVPRAGSEQAELAATLANQTNLVMIRRLEDATAFAIGPPPALARMPERIGFNNFPLDEGLGHKVRRALLYAGIESPTNHVNLASFGLVLALRHLETLGVTPTTGLLNPENLRLGLHEYVPLRPYDGAYVGADTGGYQILLDFAGPHRFTTYSLSELLRGSLPAGALRQRIVIVGATAESMRDQHRTPLRRQTYGVELHAYLADQLVRSHLTTRMSMRFVPEWLEALIVAVFCLLGVALGWQIRVAFLGPLALLLSFLLLLVVNQAGLRRGIWIPVAPAAVAFFPSALLATAYRAQRNLRERRRLMRLFSQHVSPGIAEMLWEQRDAFLDGNRPRPQTLTATILFADLEGFTGLAEKTPPGILIDWLNEYFDVMSHEILQRGGIINEYAGDAIMATFGIPLPRRTDEEIARDATQAVTASLAMASRLTQLNQRWRSERRPVAAMRIGIFTGPVVTGSIGSDERLKYAVVGDTVNAAARLQGLARDAVATASAGSADCRILAGETTWALLGDGFVGELAGSFILKGREGKTIVRQIHAARSKGE